MKSYFKFLSHNKLYTAIEAFGLSMALAFVIILVSYAFMEYRVGTHQRDAKNLYVVGGGDFLGMTLNTGKEFLPSIPEVKDWTRFGNFYVKKGAVVKQRYFDVKALAIDSNFVQLMGYHCSGCPTNRILTDKRQAIISKSFAKKAFGTVNPIGQVFKCDTLQFKVVGIMDDFDKEDLFEPTDIFVSMKLKEEEEGLSKSPMNAFGEIVTIAKLSDNADIGKVKSTLLNKFMGYWKNSWSRERKETAFLWGVSLVRWDQLYFSSITCPKFRHGNQTLVDVLLLIAFVLLLSAIFNYINLTVAQIGNRAKEMATRRLLGESVMGVVLCYFREAAFFTAFCSLVAVLLSWAFAPLFNSILDTKIALFSPSVWILLLVAYLVIVLFSGLLPAIVVSRFNPIDVVKGTLRLRSKMWFSKFFIVAQSAVSMALVVMAVTMMLQMRYLVNMPLGYDTKDILCVSTPFDYPETTNGNAELTARLKSLPQVDEAVAIANNPINSFASAVFDEKGECSSYIRLSVLDSTAMKMLGFKVLERYSNPAPGKLWLSEDAKKAYGVSRKKTWLGMNGNQHDYEVCGIVADYHCGDALDDFSAGKHNAIRIFTPNDWLWEIMVKTHGDHEQALAAVRKVCRQVSKKRMGVPIEMEMEYLDDTLKDALKDKNNMMVLVVTFMGMSIMISALGLLGMSLYFCKQQEKQIALRKVMGASVVNVVWHLSRSFLVYSLVAVIISIPICVKLMQEYLVGFTYRIAFPWWVLLVGIIFTLLVSFVSVMGCTLHAAMRNPVDSIKSE